jgi:hypothetical protein
MGGIAPSGISNAELRKTLAVEVKGHFRCNGYHRIKSLTHEDYISLRLNFDHFVDGHVENDLWIFCIKKVGDDDQDDE